MLDVHLIPAAAYRVGVEGDTFRFADGNKACLELTGLVQTFHMGVTPQDIFPPPVAEMVTDRYRTCVRTRQAVTYVSRFTGNGGGRWRTTLFPLVDADGGITTLFGICTPFTEQEHAEQMLLDASSQALGAIEGGFWVYEIASETFETSRSLTDLLAGPGHPSLGLAEYVGHIHAEDLSATVIGTSLSLETVEFRVVTHDGRMRWLKSRRQRIRDAAGKMVRLVGLVVDITEEKLAMETLRSEASTDGLTRLANRRAFDRAAAQKFEPAARAEGGAGLVLVDLDGFKPVNDRFGHRAGDEILRKVARRLLRTARRTDLVARFGGDEFAILTCDGEASSLQKLVLRIQTALSKPFEIDGETVLVGASCGTALRRVEDRAPTDLIERADKHLYAIKTQLRLRSA